MKTTVLFVVLVALITFVCSEITVNSVTRNVDLTTQVAKHSVVIGFENKNDEASFEFTLPTAQAQHLAAIRAVYESSPLQTLTISNPTQQNTSRGDSYASYQITLIKGTSSKLLITYSLTHSLQPFPAQVSQDEDQFLLYTDSPYLYTPYKPLTQSLTIRIPSSSKLESFTDFPPSKSSRPLLHYGPYPSIPAFSSKSLSVHFLSNIPLLTITKLLREIEVSHWGNVAVTETFFLAHNGPKLQAFSRYDYQRNPSGAQTVVKTVKQILPLYAEDIYYRDEIGNISSSTLTVVNDSLIMEITPRFPLFGGWKIDYYMGYNVRLDKVLSYNRKQGKFVIRFNALPEFESEMVVDEVETRVILPEGSYGVELNVTGTVDEAREKRFTYLDMGGREVVVFKVKNGVCGGKQSGEIFEVRYGFRGSAIWGEPIMLIVAYFVFFLVVIGGVRFSMKIESGRGSEGNRKRD